MIGVGSELLSSKPLFALLRPLLKIAFYFMVEVTFLCEISLSSIDLSL